jgi:bilin biosynthesis protein
VYLQHFFSPHPGVFPLNVFINSAGRRPSSLPPVHHPRPTAMASLAFTGLARVPPLRRPAHKATNSLHLASRAPRPTASPRMTLDPAPAATETSTQTEEGPNEALFKRLSHVNKNLRVKAATELAHLPPDSTVPTLLALLDRTDTAHRRAAVQTLGMIGLPAVPALIETLATSSDITVRASSAKALAAVAMYFPHCRVSFPDLALDALEAAVVNAPDPVTKLATVGCLTTLACDASIVNDADANPADINTDAGPVVAAASDSRGVLVPGNQRAYEILAGLLSNTADVALGASISGALAQIANCGTAERKADVLACLQEIVDRVPEPRPDALPAPPQAERSGENDHDEDGWGDEEDEDDDGFGYVQEMCRAHVSQLGGGSPGIE